MSRLSRSGKEQEAQPRERWTSWARGIAERHTRLAARPRGATMQLARALSPIFWHSQRWEHAAWTLAPQIHLAISPLLRVTEVGGAPVLGPRSAQTIFLQPPPSAAGRPEERPLVENLERTEQRAPTPVDLMLRRVEMSEAVTRLNRTLVAYEGLQVVRRLSDSWQRVEMRPPRTMVAPRLSETALASDASASFDSPRPVPRNARSNPGRNAEISARGSRKETESVWPPPAQPALNLDQLTDHVMRQIDHRLTAYRERLGKGA